MSDIPPGLASEIETLRQKHERQPEGRFFVPLANAYRKAGQVDEAVELLEHGLEIHPDYLSAYIVLGRCLLDREELATAEVQFRRVLEKDPQNLVALRFLGEIGLRAGRPEDAAHWYRELVAVDPMNDEARAALASIESGDVERDMDAASGSGGPSDAAEMGDAAGTDSLEVAEWSDAAPADEDSSATSDLDVPALDGLDAGPGDEIAGTLDDLDSAFADSADLEGDWEEDLEGFDMSMSDAAEADETAAADSGDDADAASPGAFERSIDEDAGSEPVPLEGFEATAPSDEPSEDDDVFAGLESLLGDDDDRDEDADGWETQDAGEGAEPVEAADLAMSSSEDAAHAAGSEERDGEDDDVVTETMARLYTEQGLYPEAAHVYRRLLAQRGEDSRLREQLEAVERAASEEGEEAATTEAGWGGGEERDEAGSGDHPFDASFEHGFAGIAPAGRTAGGETAEATAPPSGERDDEAPAQTSATIEQSMQSGADDAAPLPGLEPIGSEEFTEQFAAAPSEPEGGQDGGTIGSFLDSLLGWSAGPPAEERDADPSSGRSEEEPWLDQSRRDAPEEPGPVEGKTGRDTSGGAGQDFSYESFFDEDDGAAGGEDSEEAAEADVAAPAEPDPPVAPTPSAERAAPPAEEESSDDSGEDDDDLESFQSWLQSLKR